MFSVLSWCLRSPSLSPLIPAGVLAFDDWPSLFQTPSETPMKQISFTCPKCGSDIKLRVSFKPKHLADLIGAPCENCGQLFTEDEVEKQTRTIVEHEIIKHYRK